ncbi:MAG: SMC-Scp complex subunit ScpB [Deltaproteobacteria bacterium CG11_big_fil_rev_8_21_14_0_20_49_13]|nr:MAG: SMC-Scp complex subunit ScpB [Deltaproteobacteria bacterium CG11_big_fil_rev_8_21_14_0_20_49_13]
MELIKLKAILESLILVTEEPFTLGTMTLILENDAVTKADLETALEEIKKKYDEDDSFGFYLAEVAGGYQFRTKPFTSEYIQRLNIPKPSKLSQQSLETLAIIAYRQPIVRSEIEELRGVDSGGVLKTLLERNLVKIIGKRDEPGNPLIYATTSKFLELFNLTSLKDLPTLRDYEELERDHYKGAATPEEEQKPILEEISAAPFEQKWSTEDDTMLNDLTDSMKKLRRLEKDIFPKPVEQLVAVPNPETSATGEEDAGTPTEDTGESH